MDEKEELIYREFSPVTLGAEPYFAPFFEKNLFGDTTFSLFYAWRDRFRYAYRKWERTLAVLEHGLENRLSCILLWEGVEVRSSWDSSDYIYETDGFLALEGRRNKGKRGDVNSLMRQYPELRVEFHGMDGRDLREDCLRVFDRWCSARTCESCVYGCERKAFLRFLELDEEGSLSGLSAWGDTVCFMAVMDQSVVLYESTQDGVEPRNAMELENAAEYVMDCAADGEGNVSVCLRNGGVLTWRDGGWDRVYRARDYC